MGNIQFNTEEGNILLYAKAAGGGGFSFYVAKDDYEAPAGDAVNFLFEGGYSVPAGDDVDFDFDA